MTKEMHECELHIAQVFSRVWDKAYESVAKEGLGELSPAFFDAVYHEANRVCGTFDNFDVQFDTIQTCLKHMPKSAPLAGFCYVLEISYQIEETIFGLKLYFGEARNDDLIAKEVLHRGQYCDVYCVLSATEDEKESHMLDHFAQLAF
ncbi:MAG: hypothetical protein HWE30_08040 [Methylocystaceae bacterium]|nr:hypothetical protein [Methylocystaceae bacterium]